jgi:hypothetical protein
MRRVSVAAVIAACLLSAGAEAATYYVDQTAGRDTNAGTAAAPWKSAPGMTSWTGSARLAAGDVVYFDRADTWDVGGGPQGFYLLGGVTYIGDSWGSGVRARIRATTGFDAGLVRFRDHATLATVFQGFDVDVNGQVATGIDINHGFWQLMNGATKRVKNCIVHNVYSEQALGQYKYGIIVSNHGDATGYAENVEILDNVVRDVSRDAICLYPGDENANSRIRNIVVRGNEVYNTGQDPQYCCGSGILVKGYVVDATVEYNYVHNVKGASIFINSNETRHYGNGPTNIHVRYNLVTNATANGAVLVYDGSGGTDPKDLKIYGNIIFNSTVNGGLLFNSNLVGTLNVRVYNNTFYNAPVRIENSNATFATFEFKNNIVSYTGGVPFSDAGGKVTAHSNNIYYRGSSTLVSSRGVNYTQATLGTYETTASSNNPLFKNTAALPTGFTGVFGSNLTPNADGLSLQAGSVGVDRGVAIAAPYDGSINSVIRATAGAWDLGAYEAGAATVRPPTPPVNLRIIR